MQDMLPGQNVAQTTIEIEHIDPIPMALDSIADAYVPAELEGWLFATAPLRDCEGDLKPDAPLHSYALLDPTRVFGLAEMVEASGLEWVPLFRSEEGDRTETGPLLVQLQPGNSFVKRLMSANPDPYQAGPPWLMWKHTPALYVRSRLTLSELRRHFRKFTMVQDQEQKRVFYRFWDARCFEDFLLAHQIQGSRIDALFSGISSFVVYTPHSCLRAVSTSGAGPGPILISALSRQRYRLLRRNRLEKRLVAHFLTLPEFADTATEEMAYQVKNGCDWGTYFGMRDAADLFTFCLGFCLHPVHGMDLAWLTRAETETSMSAASRRAHVIAKASEAVERSKEIAQVEMANG